MFIIFFWCEPWKKFFWKTFFIHFRYFLTWKRLIWAKKWRFLLQKNEMYIDLKKSFIAPVDFENILTKMVFQNITFGNTTLQNGGYSCILARYDPGFHTFHLKNKENHYVLWLFFCVVIGEKIDILFHDQIMAEC